MGLKQALVALTIRTGLTTFRHARDENAGEAPAHFPALRPRGVTADEWRALQTRDDKTRLLDLDTTAR